MKRHWHTFMWDMVNCLIVINPYTQEHIHDKCEFPLIEALVWKWAMDSLGSWVEADSEYGLLLNPQSSLSFTFTANQDDSWWPKITQECLELPKTQDDPNDRLSKGGYFSENLFWQVANWLSCPLDIKLS